MSDEANQPAGSDEWHDLPDTNEWGELKDTDPTIPVDSSAEQPPTIPANFVGCTQEQLRSDGVLLETGTIELRGRGCVYAPASSLRLVPVEQGVEVWIANSPYEPGVLRFALDASQWPGALDRILKVLGRELEPYPEWRRQDLHRFSGARGSVHLNLPCEAGTISYIGPGALSDRPARLAELILELLCEHGVELDPNLVPD